MITPDIVEGRLPVTPPSTTVERHRRYRMLAVTAGQLLIIGVAVTVASAGYGPLFVDSSFLPKLGGAAFIGLLCAAVGLIRQHQLKLVIATSPLVFAAYLVYALFPESAPSGVPGASAISAVTGGVWHGLARLLTVLPPVDPAGDLLAVPALIAFCGALAAGLLTRSASTLAPAIPMVGVLVAAQLIAGSGQAFQWWLPGLFCTAALILIAIRTTLTSLSQNRTTHGGQDRLMARLMRIGGTAVLTMVLAAVAVLTIAATPIASGGSRFDPRTGREFPLEINDQLNPLVDLRRQQRAPNQPVLTLHVQAGTPTIDRVRIAVLDTYDGVQWLSSARYRQTGSTLTTFDNRSDHLQTLTVDIELHAGLRPPCLPTVGTPVRVTGQDIGFDADSGTLVSTPGTFDGYHYQLVSDVLDPTASRSSLEPDDGRALARNTQLPETQGDVISGLTTLARDLTVGLRSPIDQLDALADYLRRLGHSPDAAPGQSLARIRQLLPSADGTIDRRVTEEQTVTAFVLMARSLGFPARVAVGYRLPPRGTTEHSASTGDATAWAEVAFKGAGWVPFNPAADYNTAPQEPANPPNSTGPKDDPPTPQEEDSSDTETGQSPGEPTTVSSTPESAGTMMPILVAGTAATMALGPLLAAVLAKRIRRARRRTRGTTTDRVVGAWKETADRLRESRIPVPLSRTPTKIADHSCADLGEDADHALRAFAPLLSAALYAPTPPAEDLVVTAWDLEHQVSAGLAQRRSRMHRLITLIDPRSLYRTIPHTNPAQPNDKRERRSPRGTMARSTYNRIRHRARHPISTR